MKFKRLLLFLFAVGIFLNFVIPPFQNPDEPQHFSTILIYARGENQQDSVDKEIIQIMDENNWWRFVGMGRPSPLPEKLSDIDYLMGFRRVSNLFRQMKRDTPYHFFLGNVFRPLLKKNIYVAYYFCRLVSFLWMIGSFWLISMSFSSIFKKSSGNGPLCSGVIFTMFLPQLLLISLSVNPDSLTVFLGTLFFSSSYSLLSGKNRLKSAALLIAAGILGFFVDRSTVTLLALLILIPLFLIKKENFRKTIMPLLLVLVIFLLLGYLLIQLFPQQVEGRFRLLSEALQRARTAFPNLQVFGEFTHQFLSRLADSFLLKFGWMAYSTDKVFYILWRMLVTLSVIGIFLSFGKNFSVHRIKRTENEQLFPQSRILLLSLLALSIQLAGLWSKFGSRGSFAQGRYLFPVILPISILFLAGLKNFFDALHKAAGRIVLAGLYLFLFLYLNYSIWNYILPVFHLTLKGPHA